MTAIATAALVAPPPLDDPVETPRPAVRRRPPPGTIGAVAVMAVTLVTRLIAIRTAFDLNDDEVYYTDLGKSLGQGTFPPRFDHAPFVLHPPLFFALSALWEDILRPGPTYLDLILRTRELNVGCAAVSAGLIFYLGARLAGRGAGLAAGLLFCFDPFLQQINGRALLETSTWMFGLAGWCILINLFRRSVRHPTALALIGGVVAGLSIVDKDIAIAVVVPPLLVAIWRRWADRRTLWLATGAALVPTAIYAVALGVSGSLGLWVSQETFGLQRFLGLRKITGFSQGGHPSLVSTLIRQIGLYGLSYLICAFGLLAAVYLLRRNERADVRLAACIAIAGALTLVYATLFGTIETQMFYFAAVPSLLSLCVAGAMVVRSLSPPRATTVRRVLVGLLTLVLVGEAGVWLDLRTTPDDGMARVVSWFQTHVPKPGVIANDTDVTQLVLQRYGYTSVDAGTPAQARAEHVRYLTILSVSVKGNYGTLKTAQAAWYEAHGTLVYRFNERSYGQVSIYRPDKRGALVTQTMERPGGDRAVGDGGARPELRALTGLRGVAAFWVLFYHLIPMASENIPSLRWLQRVTVTGDLGVDLFFLLSGFVLSYAYTTDKLFGPGGGPVERLRYYLHFLSIRLARIYPVNLAVLLVLALVVFASHVAHVELHQTGTFSWDFVRNLLLVQGWDLSSHLSWDGPAWSVSCEWAAYLAFPFIFLMVSRVRRTRSAVLGMVASLAAMLIFYGFFGAGQPQLTYHYPLVRIAGEFIAGCFLYRVYASRSGRPSRWTRLRSVVGPCSLGAALIVAAILNAVGLAAVWVVPLFVLVLVGTWRDDTPWGRLLSSPRMVHAGEASYALYMIHYPALLILQKVWSVPSSTGLRLIIIVVGTTGIWVSALLVYRYFEVPARRHLRVASQVLLPASARQPLDQQSPMGAPRRRGQGAIGATARLRRDSLLVLAGNVVTGLSNYGLTLALIWILPARQFSQVASLAALLLVAGTAAQASIPWVVARELVHRPFGDPARRQAVGFALVVALVFGAATAAIVFALSSGYAGSGVELAAVVAIPAIFVTQVGNGYLQGSHRFRFYAVLVVLEGVVRLGFGAALAAAGAGPAGAVGGYAVGAVITAGIALWIVRRDLAWPRRVSVGLWQQLGGIGGIQVGVALLAMLDVICESVVQGTSRAFAGYQAMLVFTRIPLFLSAAISAVAYPRLSKQGSDDTTIVAETTSLFLLTAAFCVAVVSSLPTSLLSLVFPRGYAHSAGLLLPLAIAGFACGQVNLSTTLLQAKSAFRTAFRVLAVGLPVATVLLVLASSSVLRLAWVAAAADGTAAVVLVVVTDRFFAGRVIAKPTLVGVLATAPLVAVLRVLRPDPVAWLLGVVVLSVVFVALVRRGLRDDPLPLTAPRRLPVDTRVHPAVVVPVKPVVMNGAARPPLRPHSHPVEVLES